MKKEYRERLARFNGRVVEAYDRYCSEREARDPAFRRHLSTLPEFPLLVEEYEQSIVAKILLDKFDGDLKGRRVLDIGSGRLSTDKEFFLPSSVIGLGAHYVGVSPKLPEYPKETVEKAGYNCLNGTSETVRGLFGADSFDATVSMSVIGLPTYQYVGENPQKHQELLSSLFQDLSFLTKQEGLTVHYLRDEPGAMDKKHYEGLTPELLEHAGFEIDLFELGPRGFIIAKRSKIPDR